MKNQYTGSIFGLMLPLLGVACGSVPEGQENLGQAQLEISTVPSGVQCIKITGTVGSTNVSPPLVTVASGTSSTSIGLGQLPFGAATFAGSAYSIACASVTASSVPAWVSDPASATLSAGALTSIPMVFRRNNVVTANATFVDNIVNISVGAWVNLARMADGTVLQWGSLSSGTPTPVPSLTNVAQVSAGNSFACARKNDGTVWCWGYGSDGQLGPNGGSGSAPTPVSVPLPGAATDISSGQAHACAVLASHNIYCWGRNSDGQLGNGTTTSSATPVASYYGARVVAGGNHTCAIGSDGLAACWGNNLFGQLGDGTTTNRLTGVRVLTLTDTVDLALGGYHTCAVRGDSSLRCWGSNQFGQVGDGTTTQRLTPTVVTAINDASNVATGYFHTCVRRANGTAYCWGEGKWLGDGVGDDKQFPTLVPGLSGVVAVRAASGNHTCTEMSDRTVKCWGDNSYSEIGDGTSVFAAKPTDVKFN